MIRELFCVFGIHEYHGYNLKGMNNRICKWCLKRQQFENGKWVTKKN